MRRILLGDCARVLPGLPAGFARLAYIDPPFNTGRVQQRDRIEVRSTASQRPGGSGTRRGFGGRLYDVTRVESGSFDDTFDDFEGFLLPRVEAALRCVTDDGSIFVHLDCREVHYV